jgi:uncharacterized protein YaiE (UPF0345 family)
MLIIFMKGANLKMKFDNVSLEKTANIYFDGKVTSRAFYLPSGERKTLGIMLPGEYEFGTKQKEIMEITSGELDVLLPGESEWRTVKAGDSFTIPADSSYKANPKTVVDYCCSYIEE